MEYTLKLKFNLQSQTFKVRILGDSMDTYTNLKPTLVTIRVVPSSISAVAGSWNTVQLQFFSQNEKLYHFSDHNGWYAEQAKKITVNSNAMQNVTISNGNLKGTYSIEFKVSRAETSKITFSVAD
jgi:hypothetical protein